MSFYGQVEANVVLVHRLDFAQTLAPCLLSQNMDLVVEVARVFGNFSQSKEIRQLLVDNRGYFIRMIMDRKANAIPLTNEP